LVPAKTLMNLEVTLNERHVVEKKTIRKINESEEGFRFGCEDSTDREGKKTLFACHPRYEPENQARMSSNLMTMSLHK